MVESYRDLKVWQRAIEISPAIYRLTTSSPKEEMLGFASQTRRATVSVASNRAEGYGRGFTGEYKQFLAMARSSTLKLQTQLFLATELGYGDSVRLKTTDDLSNGVSRMPNSLLAKL